MGKTVSAEMIEKARREYVAAMGTNQEQRARRKLEQLVDRARCEQMGLN